MIKLYKNWKLKKTYKWVYVKNIQACATILAQEGIRVDYPGKNLMKVGRMYGYNLLWY